MAPWNFHRSLEPPVLSRFLVALAAVLLPTLALADVDPRFAKLRDESEPLGGLGAFLEKYVGACEGALVDPQCKAQAEAFRKKYQGKQLYMIVTEDDANMLAPGPYSPATGEYTINITPFFPGGRYAMTHGTPKKTDANGNPVMPLLTVTGTLPEGWNIQMFSRMFSMRGVRAQVVFTPQSVWSLPKKGGGKNYGVTARIDGLLVSEGRTGGQLGLWLNGKDANARR
ncbi:hypothetical protein MYSTI_04840 [Myxococcus stipitatus DSM 14675]|uniref:Uncharacterized protein n=1 Tax=Myxococcus stipitatus (strain DSM 14675 / JCM 12634 / Mx s8) TaxID=1278073 RepID=L7UI50_MYXSD|nr:hypothetical protein MYSTI_04840 [Myxococcus stipitatus DSM 14675]